MIDFWFMFGAMIIEDPSSSSTLLSKIGTVNPGFDAIPNSSFSENNGQTVIPRPRYGHLKETDTVKLRQDIRDHLSVSFPGYTPPISLYAASKMCQLWHFAADDFKTVAINVHDCFKKATAASGWPPPTGAVSLLGLCLIDDNLSHGFVAGTGLNYAQEFGVTTNDAKWPPFVGMLSSQKFKDAQSQVLAGWTQCGERMIFYPESSIVT